MYQNQLRVWLDHVCAVADCSITMLAAAHRQFCSRCDSARLLALLDSHRVLLAHFALCLWASNAGCERIVREGLPCCVVL